MKIETQRSRSNLFAFRRLKWGKPKLRPSADRAAAGPEVIELEPKRKRERLADAIFWTMAIGAVAALVWAAASL
ncbi:hypothetical protein [Devosia limi]|uniref:hypothetical protein n=1 Tax=Devosia limi TaxID=288995 RepID=UPI001160B9CA|nr:hypothetical protein [Devosia limi]